MGFLLKFFLLSWVWITKVRSIDDYVYLKLVSGIFGPGCLGGSSL